MTEARKDEIITQWAQDVATLNRKWREEIAHSISLERKVIEQSAQVEQLENAYASLNQRWLRTIESDREFLQQVADSHGIRTDEVTVAFLERAAVNSNA